MAGRATAASPKASPKTPPAVKPKFNPKKWPALKVELWPLDKIKPYARNARTHPPAQIDLLATLMLKHGVDQAIVVDEKGEVLKGHGRRLAAYAAKFTHYPVSQHFGLTPAEKIAMRMADNQVALLSGWDAELVRGEIEQLKIAEYPIELLGFGDTQLVSFTTTPGPPASFPQFDENLSTEFCCPKCSYRWSGKPTPESN